MVNLLLRNLSRDLRVFRGQSIANQWATPNAETERKRILDSIGISEPGAPSIGGRGVTFPRANLSTDRKSAELDANLAVAPVTLSV